MCDKIKKLHDIKEQLPKRESEKENKNSLKKFLTNKSRCDKI